MDITYGKIKSAQKTVVYGPEGIGKSTFASKFPHALFIDTEGSTKHLDVARTPRPTSWAMLLQQVRFVRDNPGLCKTLIIDTADWAEQLCSNEVCTKNKKNGIEEFGYGKGYVYLAEEFGRLLNLLEELIDRGINVCMTAHAKMRKFEQPDEMGAYDRWEMKLQRITAPLVKEWADIVLFANYKTYVVNVDGEGTEKGKNKAQGGARVMYTSHHPCWDAKNRHGLDPEVKFDYAEIAHILDPEATTPDDIPVYTAKEIAQRMPKPAAPQEVPSVEQEQPAADPAPQEQALDESPPPQPQTVYWHHAESSCVFTANPGEEQCPDCVQISESDYKRLKKEYEEAKKEAAPSPPPSSDPSDDSEIPRALADLMRENRVSLHEIKDAVARKGHFPRDTPFRNYPQDYVEGVLIGAWPKVFAVIEQNRKSADTPF